MFTFYATVFVNKPDGETGQCVLVAHDKKLAHLDDSLKLSGFVAGSLKALEQLLSLGRGRRGSCSIQDQVVHPGSKNSGQVGWEPAGFKHGWKNRNQPIRYIQLWSLMFTLQPAHVVIVDFVGHADGLGGGCVEGCRKSGSCGRGCPDLDGGSCSRGSCRRSCGRVQAVVVSVSSTPAARGPAAAGGIVVLKVKKKERIST